MPKDSGGSSTNTIQNADPWKGQQPYLLEGFQQALGNYQSQGPNYYPRSTVVPFSPQSEMAMRLTQGRALQGNPVFQNASDMFNRTISGDFMNSNPYLDSMYDRAASAVTRNFGEGVLPGIDSQFAGAGRYGSDLWANQRDMAYDQLGRSLEGMASNLYGTDYANERNRMMQAGMFAPQIANQDYFDLSQLANVGQAVEGKAGENLQDMINRYSYYQNLPDQKLQNFMQNIQGNYGGTTSGTNTTSQQGNPFANALGMGLTGYSLANNLGLLGGGSALAGASALPSAFTLASGLPFAGAAYGSWPLAFGL